MGSNSKQTLKHRKTKQNTKVKHQQNLEKVVSFAVWEKWQQVSL